MAFPVPPQGSAREEPALTLDAGERTGSYFVRDDGSRWSLAPAADDKRQAGSAREIHQPRGLGSVTGNHRRIIASKPPFLARVQLGLEPFRTTTGRRRRSKNESANTNDNDRHVLRRV